MAEYNSSLIKDGLNFNKEEEKVFFKQKNVYVFWQKDQTQKGLIYTRDKIQALSKAEIYFPKKDGLLEKSDFLDFMNKAIYVDKVNDVIISAYFYSNLLKFIKNTSIKALISNFFKFFIIVCDEFEEAPFSLKSLSTAAQQISDDIRLGSFDNDYCIYIFTSKISSIELAIKMLPFENLDFINTFINDSIKHLNDKNVSLDEKHKYINNIKNTLLHS